MARETGVKHPAKFSDAVLEQIAPFIQSDWLILDPFAGTGRIHELADKVGAASIGVEIEPEWAEMHPFTMVGDALNLNKDWDDQFDAVVTSPVYGNRMSDHFEAKDTSRRITYRHVLGRPLHPNNSGRLQWGNAYRTFHERAWEEVRRVLKPNGTFILNVSDHIRAGARQHVTGWHINTVRNLGFKKLHDIVVETPRMKFGENHKARVPFESVLVFDAPG